MNNETCKLSRRKLLGAGSVLGAAGLLSASLTHAGEKTPEAVPEKFAGLRPLRPVARYSELEGVAPSPPPFAVLVLNKAAYGPRPGEVSDFDNLPGFDDDARLGLWLDEQLYPDDLLDTELNDRISPFKDPGLAYDMIDKTAAELWQYGLDADYHWGNVFYAAAAQMDESQFPAKRQSWWLRLLRRFTKPLRRAVFVRTGERPTRANRVLSWLLYRLGF